MGRLSGNGMVRPCVRAVLHIEKRLAVILPHLETKSELADKPTRHYNWSVRAAITAAYTAALAAGAMVIDVSAASLSDQ
jgi:hypothetical protein